MSRGKDEKWTNWKSFERFDWSAVFLGPSQSVRLSKMARASFDEIRFWARVLFNDYFHIFLLCRTIFLGGFSQSTCVPRILFIVTLYRVFYSLTLYSKCPPTIRQHVELTQGVFRGAFLQL